MSSVLVFLFLLDIGLHICVFVWGLFLLACMLYLFAPTFLFYSFLTMTKAEEAILRDLHGVLEWMWAF